MATKKTPCVLLAFVEGAGYGESGAPQAGGWRSYCPSLDMAKARYARGGWGHRATDGRLADRGVVC